MLAISIRGQLNTRSHLVLKLKKDRIYTFNALNDIPGKVFSLSQGTFTRSFHFKLSKYSIWQLTILSLVLRIFYFIFTSIFIPLYNIFGKQFWSSFLFLHH